MRWWWRRWPRLCSVAAEQWEDAKASGERSDYFKREAVGEQGCCLARGDRQATSVARPAVGMRWVCGIMGAQARGASWTADAGAREVKVQESVQESVQGMSVRGMRFVWRVCLRWGIRRATGLAG